MSLVVSCDFCENRGINPTMRSGKIAPNALQFFTKDRESNAFICSECVELAMEIIMIETENYFKDENP